MQSYLLILVLLITTALAQPIEVDGVESQRTAAAAESPSVVDPPALSNDPVRTEFRRTAEGTDPLKVEAETVGYVVVARCDAHVHACSLTQAPFHNLAFGTSRLRL